jgi:hypothetical protein
MSDSDKNLSMEHQPKGSATNLSDTLDRQNEDVPVGQRQWAADSATKPTDAAAPSEEETDATQNASARRGGRAVGGIDPHATDPTSPAAAAARSQERDDAMNDGGFGDDGARSTYKY